MLKVPVRGRIFCYETYSKDEALAKIREPAVVAVKVVR